MTVVEKTPTAHPAHVAGETRHPAGDAAPGIKRIDAAAVNAKEQRQLYARHQKIHPKLAHGLFRRIKWGLLFLTLGVYYALPWVRWDRGPDLPNQAVLADMANSRFYFFFLEVWPQELYYITGLLVLAALGLFLVTAIAGRVWCGYFCPQTVWTDLMVAFERLWQGDRNARILLDKQPWGLSKIFKKGMTHLSWLLIGASTGGAWVFYFADAPTLAGQLVNGTAPFQAYLFIGIFTATTYGLGGIAREQVCIYMCPWPRIQGAMLDRDSLLITYRDFRGEPRGPLRKSQGFEGRGDCIDCKACVAVCPMGIDIRDGAQLECITCGLCIDACDEIMDKVGRPRGLVAYDTYSSLESEAQGGPLKIRPIRPRTMIYVVLMSVVAAAMAFGLSRRTVLEVNVLHDREPLYVALSDGSIRNGFTFKILNKRYETRKVHIGTSDLDGAKLTVIGLPEGADPVVDVAPDDLRELRVYVAVPPSHTGKLAKDHNPFKFVVRDMEDGTTTGRAADFRSPQ